MKPNLNTIHSTLETHFIYAMGIVLFLPRNWQDVSAVAQRNNNQIAWVMESNTAALFDPGCDFEKPHSHTFSIATQTSFQCSNHAQSTFEYLILTLLLSRR